MSEPKRKRGARRLREQPRSQATAQPRSQAAAQFDAAYYDRFYRRRETRVSGYAEIAKLGRFVCSYLDYLGVPVRQVLDAGCGLGRWQKLIAAHYPRARYTGIEFSEYLCERFGWTRASVADYRTRNHFDLVICQGVLQYLDDRAAARALANLARLCRGALYLEVLTAEDWRDACDRTATDGQVHRRPAEFYRKRLARHFISAGGGLFIRRNADVVLYALEANTR